MVNNFDQQRSAHGPSSGKRNTKYIRNFIYIVFVFAIVCFLYSTKILFEERYSAREDIVIEKTGPHRKRRRAKADAIRAQKNLRSVSPPDMTLSEGEDSIFQFDIPNIDGENVNIGETFGGKYKVMLIVNVASK